MALGSPFDRYTFHARILPGLIAAFPLIIIVALAVPSALVNYLLTLVSGCGLVYLLAAIVRTLGRRQEARLSVRWHGMPTTHRLRYREAEDRSTFDRRRAVLEAVLGRSLPSRRTETASPQKADLEYIAATRQLISLVRQRADQFPRVQDENIGYGFMRNLLALKPIALVIIVVGAVVCIRATGWFDSAGDVVVVAIALGVLALVWLFYITPKRVWEAGCLYADRLFDCLDTPSTLTPVQTVPRGNGT